MKEKQESVEDRFDKEFYTTKTDRSSIKAFIQTEILKAQEEILDKAIGEEKELDDNWDDYSKGYNNKRQFIIDLRMKLK